MSKLTVAVIFGGQSSEHIVSCMSAVNVIEHIDSARYNIILVGITQEGHWIKADSLEDVKSGAWRDGKVGAALLPDATRKCILLMDGDKVEEVRVDIVFPVLHGLYGEDGTIQGLLELARIPYVGCGVLASAVSMDKLYTKIIVSDLGIRQAGYEPVYREELEDMEQVVDRIEKHFPYPVFIKPSNAGSSRGISKAGNRQELEAGLLEAARHDRKLLVEETIVGREIECSVFGGGRRGIEASGLGKSWQQQNFMILTPSISMRSPGRSRTPSFRTVPRKRCARQPWTYSGQWTDTVWPGWTFLLRMTEKWYSTRLIPCLVSRPSACIPCCGRPGESARTSW